MDASTIIDSLAGLPPWAVLIFISMLPFVELRGSLPVALAGYHMPLVQAFILCYIGNLIPVPFILLIFDRVEAFLRRWKLWNRFFDWLFERTRRRASEKVERYEELGVMLFVAIPLPFTGAWTGALISYLFGFRFGKSMAVIMLGVFIAGVIVAALTMLAIGAVALL